VVLRVPQQPVLRERQQPQQLSLLHDNDFGKRGGSLFFFDWGFNGANDSTSSSQVI